MKTIKTHQRFILGIIICLGIGLACVPQGWLSNITIAASAQQRPRLNQPILRRSDGESDPRLHLRRGFELPLDTAVRQAVAAGFTEPTALAIGDFDEDGVPDLITGYLSLGRGLLALHRGQPEALSTLPPGVADDDSPRSPFLPAEHAFELTASPDFISTGDFNADGHADVVAAARGGAALYLLPGDGRGGFGQAERIELPGGVTALAAGEINRADGLTDLIVGITGTDGSEVLVFESPEGALRGQPEVFTLPAAATALALGQLDDDYPYDLAIAAGNELVIVHGRDRRLSLDETQQAEVPEANLERQSFSATVTGLAVGNFLVEKERRAEIAVMAEDGALYVLARHASEWNRTTERTVDARSRSVRLLRAKVSSLPTDDLIVLDGANRQLRVVTSEATEASREVAGRVAARSLHTAARFEIDAAPVAALPVRLPGSALDGLVVLRQGESAPVVAAAASSSTFVVNSTDDTDDGACSEENCTLREAIKAANANPGEDKIVFRLGGGTPLIKVGATGLGQLPTITDTVSINGNSGGSTRIELNGVNAGSLSAGLTVSADKCLIKGLVINQFERAGLLLTFSSGSVVQNCLLGTDATGTVAIGNGTPFGGGQGIELYFSADNTIGGLTATERNVISANTGSGIALMVGDGNVVQGNYIGTDITGTADLGNHFFGLDIQTPSNIVGGTVAGAGNIISGNDLGGVKVSPNLIFGGSAGNLILGNLIGVGATGGPLGGAVSDGIVVSLGDSTAGGNFTIGGPSPLARNVISNHVIGIIISGTSNALGQVLVQGNFIGTDASGMNDMGNTVGGIHIFGTTKNTIGGAVPGARNIISGNDGFGIKIGLAASSGNRIQGNYIGMKVNGTDPLPNGTAQFASAGVLISDGSQNNLIGGATHVVGLPPGNLISGNTNTGISFVSSAQGNLVQGNLIGTDATGTLARGNGGHGIGITNSLNNTIGGMVFAFRNVISSNTLSGVSFGQGVATPEPTGNLVQGNFIGTDINGTAPLGNAQMGVVFAGFGAGTNNTIGGAASGAGNRIAFNSLGGVRMVSGTNNPIRGNSIFSNGGLGINLGLDIVTPNDLGDLDTGPNNLQNFPELSSASSNGSTTIVAGKLSSTTNTTFTLDFFANDTCDPSGNGEGKTYLGSATVTILPLNLSVNFVVTLPVGVPAGQVITATATDPGGNTSEFSACQGVTLALHGGSLNAPSASPALAATYASPDHHPRGPQRVANRQVTVINPGLVKAHPVQVLFKFSEDSGYHRIGGLVNVGTVQAGGTKIAETIWRRASPGTYLIRVTGDPLNLIEELREDNNVSIHTVAVL